MKVTPVIIVRYAAAADILRYAAAADSPEYFIRRSRYQRYANARHAGAQQQ